HPWAKPGAIAAECAKEQNPEAFWKLYKSFFENQGQMSKDNVKEKSTEFLGDTGIDMTKWADCFDNQKSAAAVDAQMQEGSSVSPCTKVLRVAARPLVPPRPDLSRRAQPS